MCWKALYNLGIDQLLPSFALHEGVHSLRRFTSIRQQFAKAKEGLGFICELEES